MSQDIAICNHCRWTSESPRVHVGKFYGRFPLIRSVWRASKFSVFKIDKNCNFVGLLHYPFWPQLILAPFGHYFINILNYIVYNIPSSPAYGVFISQLIRYARACSSYECFILRARRLSSKLLKQVYLVERLKSSFRKFYGRYGDLIQQYEVSLSRMLNDILTLDQQWLPNQSDFPPISWPWYRLWPSPNYEWFPWSICNGCGMPAGNAYPSGHLVPSPILGLANAPIVEIKFLELAMSLLDFSPRIPLCTFSILLG